MGNSTYLENNQNCINEADSMGNVPDMVTIDAIFSIKKDPFNASESFIKFTWKDSNCQSADNAFDNWQGTGPWMSNKVPLTDGTMLNSETWEVERIDFEGELDGTGSSSGFFDFTTGTGMSTSGITPDTTGVDTTTVFKITDFKSAKVPEPSVMIGLLAVGGLGIASKLKKKSK